MTITLPKIKIAPKTWAKIILLVVIFVTGLTIGHKSTLDSPEGHQPPAAIMAQLDWAQNHSKAACKAVWSTSDGKAGTVAGWEVVCGDEDTAVKDFNDGFADSKADDCQQGFDKACKWLATTKK